MTAATKFVFAPTTTLRAHSWHIRAHGGLILSRARIASLLQPLMRKRTTTRLIHNATNHDENTLYILGVGNLGKYVAYALAKHVPDQPVTLLFHREGLLHEWDAAGRTIECIEDGESSREGSFAVEVLSSSDIAEKDDESQVCSGPPIKHLIVATKTYNTTAALRRVRSRLSRESNILFLQNGMGTTDEVSAALFPDPHSRPSYYAGICYAGIYSKPPFGFVHAGRGALTLGQVDSLEDAVSARRTARDNILLQSLSAAGPTLGTELVTPMQLRVAQLYKLAVNSTINPFSVVFNCKNGRVVESETQREALNQLLLHETGPILRALLPDGVPTHLRDKFQHDKLVELVFQVAKDTADNFSSMLQDVRAGRQTEVDYINGYLVRKAEDHGIETPRNAGLAEFVKRASRNKGLYNPDPFGFPDGELNPACAQLRRFWSLRQATGSGKSSDETGNKPDRQAGQEGVVETHDPDRTRQ